MAASKEAWRGYTFDELRFQRVLSMTRLELQKESLAQQFDNLRNGRSTDGSAGWMTKLFGAFNYIDYAVFALTIGRKLVRLFRRKKY